jgi:concanavalin A-like lectin/glucanase superfamily protein
MTPRRPSIRSLTARAAFSLDDVPDHLRHGLVWAPDLATLDDPISGIRGTADGTTHALDSDYRSGNGTTDRLDWANVRDFGTTPRPSSCFAWVYPTSVAAGLVHIWTAASTGPAQSVIFRRSADALEFSHAYDTTGLRHVSGAVLTVNTWHAVGYSYDGSATAAGALLYVAGAEVGSYATTTNPVGTPRAANGVWSLFGRVEADTNNWAGRIRMPMVWDRALTAGEHAALAMLPRPT